MLVYFHVFSSSFCGLIGLVTSFIALNTTHPRRGLHSHLASLLRAHMPSISDESDIYVRNVALSSEFLVISVSLKPSDAGSSVGPGPNGTAYTGIIRSQTNRVKIVAGVRTLRRQLCPSLPTTLEMTTIIICPRSIKTTRRMIRTFEFVIELAKRNDDPLDVFTLVEMLFRKGLAFLQIDLDGCHLV